MSEGVALLGDIAHDVWPWFAGAWNSLPYFRMVVIYSRALFEDSSSGRFCRGGALSSHTLDRSRP